MLRLALAMAVGVAASGTTIAAPMSKEVFEQRMLACQMEVPRLKTRIDDQQSIGEAIQAALPELLSGSKQRAEAALRGLKPRLRTGSIVEEGDEFVPSGAGYPGVKVMIYRHKASGLRSVAVQPLDALAKRPAVKGRQFLGAANGVVIEHDDRIFLVSNTHVLEYAQEDVVDQYRVLAAEERYDMDVAVIELPRKSVPEGLLPARLSERSDEQIIGRPFFITGIDTDSRVNGPKSLLTVTGFVLPLPGSVMFSEEYVDKFDASRAVSAHGGIHEDCIPDDGGESGIFLGGVSGSPVFDFVRGEIIGIFFGGVPFRMPDGELVKVVGFVSAERIRRAFTTGRMPVVRMPVEWIR